jgi:ribosomal protein L11 methyltransferase
MSDYIQIVIPVREQAAKDILVAQLALWGFEGFEEERDQLKAFIVAGDFDEPSFEQFAAEHNLGYVKQTIAHTNWNALWESDYKPVVVDNFCAIRAGFHGPVKGIQYDIEITPKMSFGTGHHATTYMMVEAMSGTVIKDKTVFDFGTGTGVLAILAEKMGASAVTAIDNDDWCITNAAENVAQNNCLRVNLYKSDSLPGNVQYDVILANINRSIILENLIPLKQHLSSGGVILCSGLLASDRQVVLEAAQDCHLQLVRDFERNGWICLVLDNL